MASNRDHIINLIIQKTDMNQSEATSFLSELTQEINEAYVEDFINQLTEVLGNTAISKIDGARTKRNCSKCNS
jgi:hypothetical protein